MPEIKVLMGAVRQFQAAAQLMTTQLTRMTIDTYGAAAGLGLANVALAGLGQQLGVTRETVATARLAFDGLDQAMAQMEGPTALQGSLVALNREAEFVRGGIDTLLKPALGDLLPVMGRVYEAMGVLATASVRFGNAMVEVLNGVTRAAVAALSNLGRVSGGLASRAGGAEPPKFENAWETFIGNQHVGQIVGEIPYGGLAMGLIGGLTELVRGPEKERQLREWHQNQIVSGMPRAAGSLGATDTRDALRNAQSTRPALEGRLADLERQARSERGRREDVYDARTGVKTGSRIINEPTAQTQQLLDEAQWAVRANREWVTSLTRHQNALTEQNRESEATIKRLAGAAGSINVGAAAGDWGSQGERAAFVAQPPDTSLRNEAASVRNLIRDYQYRRGHQQDASGVFEQLYHAAEEFRNKLAAGGLSGTQSGTYAELVSAIESAVPTLDPTNQVVRIEPVLSAPVMFGGPALLDTPATPIVAARDAYDQFVARISEAGERFFAWAGRAAEKVGSIIGGALLGTGKFVLSIVQGASNFISRIPVLGRVWDGVGYLLGLTGRITADVAGLLARAPGAINGVISRIPGVGKIWRDAPEALRSIPGVKQAEVIGAQQVSSSGTAFAGLLASFTPLGMVATLLQGVFQGLAPLIDAVKEPLRIVGEIFGKALAPILKAIFPVFKLLAIAATWVGQIFFTVSGAILEAIGKLVRGIGNLVNRLPGSPGDPLVRAGQAMIDLGKGYKEGARALEEGREEIKKLEFGETAKTVEQANEALRNVPEGFKVAVARFQAASPMAAAAAAGIVAASVPAPVAAPEPVVENRTVTIESVQIVSNNPEQIWRELQPVMERESYRHDGSILA